MMHHPTSDAPTDSLTREEVMVQILLGVPTDRLRTTQPTASQGLQELVRSLDKANPCRLGGGRLQRRLRASWLPAGRLLVDEDTWRLCTALMDRSPQASTAPSPPPAVHTLPDDSVEGWIQRGRLAERAALRVLGVSERYVIEHARKSGASETSDRGLFCVGLALLAKGNRKARALVSRSKAHYWQAVMDERSQRIIRARAKRAIGERDDAVQEFCIVAVKAAARFNANRGTWSACLRWWLRSKAFDLVVRFHDGAAGSTMLQLAQIARREIRRARRDGYEVTVDEIATQLGSPVDRVRAALDVSPPLSLDAPLSEGGGTLVDTLNQEEADLDAQAKHEVHRAHEEVWAALLSLPACEAWVLARRQGLGGRMAPTKGHKVPKWDTLRRELGVSMTSIREIDRKARERFDLLIDSPEPHLDRERFEALLDATADGRGMAGVCEPGEDPRLRHEILRTAARR